jgi:glycosyltransferase involved in cell wall biosynthesis
MRALVTASTLPRWPGDAMPAFVLDQVRALARAHPELEVELLAPHHAGAAREEEWDGIAVRRFRYLRPEALQRLAYPAILPNLRRNPWLGLQVPPFFAAEFAAVLGACRARRPDVIYSHWFTPQGLVGGAVGALLGIPHVFTTHSSDVAVLARLPGLGPALVRAFAGRARACTAVSRRTAEKLLAFFPEPAARAAMAAKLAVLPMGVEPAAATLPAAREALRADLGLSGRTVFLFLGRLTEKKGLDVLLDAFAPLAAERADAQLVVAGEGELRAALEARAQAPPLRGRVRLPGFVAGEAKRRLLAAADAMIVPSVVTADGDAEGLPVALLEGLAAGLPCIATDVSGADEVLAEGREGYLVPQRDAAALAAALRRYCALGPAERAALAAAARERSRPFEWPALAEAHWRHLFAPGARGGR